MPSFDPFLLAHASKDHLVVRVRRARYEGGAGGFIWYSFGGSAPMRYRTK